MRRSSLQDKKIATLKRTTKIREKEVTERKKENTKVPSVLEMEYSSPSV